MLKLDVSCSVSVLLSIGKVEASGSFNYLKEKKVTLQFTKILKYCQDFIWKDFEFADIAVLHYLSETRTDTLNVDILRY